VSIRIVRINGDLIRNKNTRENRFKTDAFPQICMTVLPICYKVIEMDHGIIKTKQKRTCLHDVIEHRDATDVLIPFGLKHGVTQYS